MGIGSIGSLGAQSNNVKERGKPDHLYYVSKMHNKYNKSANHMQDFPRPVALLVEPFLLHLMVGSHNDDRVLSHGDFWNWTC